MGTLIQDWEAIGSPKAVFLNCYRMMTNNTLAALAHGEFADPRWVDRLLHRFADYYFEALEIYESDPLSAPVVWQLAHDTTRDPDALPLQNLLLGVNAHINYDLVLTLDELLQPEWAALSEEARLERYNDYTHVNDIIGRTIDQVQDEILAPMMPVAGIFDRLMGPLDELLLSHIITKWRESVWENACRLLTGDEEIKREVMVEQVEAAALDIGRMIRW
jgi:hypothetical protein